MSFTKSIGKNTLGGGKRMNVDLKTVFSACRELNSAWNVQT